MLHVRRYPMYFKGVHRLHQFIRVMQIYGSPDAHQICTKNIACNAMVVINIFEHVEPRICCTLRCSDTFAVHEVLPNDAAVLRAVVDSVMRTTHEV